MSDRRSGHTSQNSVSVFSYIFQRIFNKTAEIAGINASQRMRRDQKFGSLIIIVGRLFL